MCASLSPYLHISIFPYFHIAVQAKKKSSSVETDLSDACLNYDRLKW